LPGRAWQDVTSVAVIAGLTGCLAQALGADSTTRSSEKDCNPVDRRNAPNGSRVRPPGSDLTARSATGILCRMIPTVATAKRYFAGTS
jgi:hypothetical protein